ncbi:hypothetical protein FSP39_018224 [Pinctada imbricata]|uniref:Sodium/nucleoside cotransporter n=1 Tax=Pinctada imbricata TaxID=66713 RepID=A0AA89C6W6_PINIB|nr:hypothetical protein FSP39_018224 [Pinctada imbricata]
MEKQENETKKGDALIGHFTEKVNGAYDNKAIDIDKNDLEKPKNENIEDGEYDYVQKDDEEPTGFSRTVFLVQSMTSSVYQDNKSLIWRVIYVVLVLLYFAYFGYCMYHEFGDEGSIRLLVCTVLAVIFIAYDIVLTHTGGCSSMLVSNGKALGRISKRLHVFLVIAFTVFAIVYIIVDIALKTPRNLISLAGIAIFILLFFVFSFNPAKVKWRPVFWGLAIQFIFALLILRTDPGFQAFDWLGDRVQEFLSYSDSGAIFVFGEEYERHFFAFKVLPVIVFFSTVTSILYYLGVMQFIIKHIARFMAMSMGTSPTESLNAAGNIFLGQSEAPLMIRPFLPDMTASELHAVCTGGFATIAGSVLAAYILYGVPANHLLSASVMSAPAALAMAKLFWPETEMSKAKSEDVYNMQKGQERNIIEAASMGASQSIKLVANVAVNVMAFIALLEFVNSTLKWFGERAGLNSETDPLTFQFICSYVFWPIAFFMGVETVDCRRVAEMIGIKTFINEFVAYTSLSVYIDNQKNLTWYEGLRNTTNNATGEVFTAAWYKEGNDIHYRDLNITLKGGILEQRSVVISTYALCGFSNIGSIGIMLGALGAMAPSRKSDLSRVVIRAMIAGNVACFMTACIAGSEFGTGQESYSRCRVRQIVTIGKITREEWKRSLKA